MSKVIQERLPNSGKSLPNVNAAENMSMNTGFFGCGRTGFVVKCGDFFDNSNVKDNINDNEN